MLRKQLEIVTQNSAKQIIIHKIQAQSEEPIREDKGWILQIHVA